MRHPRITHRQAGRTFSRKLRILLALSVAGCSASGDPLPGDTVVVVPSVKPTPTPTPTPTSPPTGPNLGAVDGMPDGFNAAYYAANNPDVVAHGMDLFHHYKWFGRNEGRAPHKDWRKDAVVAGGPEVINEPASIPSNFNVNDWLVPSWGHGKVADSGAPDVVGAFRFICNPSHNAYNDPIIYPGKKNGSHLHTFFGNTAVDENSTYESLRKTGDSTCNNALNRSAYWIPSMMTPAGKVVMPDFVSIYYKRRPSNDPECKRRGKACVALPRGLRYVFGYNMNKPAASDGFHLNCQGPGAAPGHFANIPEAARACPSGSQLGAIIGSPDCWDGKNLDSPDHRSHMAYVSYGTWGYERCPATHPYVVPTFTLGAWYTTDDTLDRSGDTSPNAKTWYFSSDRMAGMSWQTPGSTFHADWFGAWDDDVMKMWTDGCIEKLLTCSGGDLGNGKQLRMYDGFKWNADPRLVDPPKI